MNQTLAEHEPPKYYKFVVTAYNLFSKTRLTSGNFLKLWGPSGRCHGPWTFPANQYFLIQGVVDIYKAYANNVVHSLVIARSAFRGLEIYQNEAALRGVTPGQSEFRDPAKKLRNEGFRDPHFLPDKEIT